MKALRILLAAGLLSTAATAHPAIFLFTGTLAPEAVGATGTGTVQVDYDDVAHTLRIQTTFSGLSGTTSVAHIHCCTSAAGTGTAGVAVLAPTLTGFPAGVQAGTYDQTFDLTLASSFSASFITNNGGTPATAEVVLIAAMNAGGLGNPGRAYLNIHTNPTFTGGEIRAFLIPVPEPGTVALMLAGLGALGFAALQRHRR
jgi:hypothetical protein